MSLTQGGSTIPAIRLAWTASDPRVNVALLLTRLDGASPPAPVSPLELMNAMATGADGSVDLPVVAGAQYKVQYRTLFAGRVSGLTTVEAALTAGAAVVPVGDISGLGDLAAEDTVDLGSGFIRDSGGTPIGDSAVLNSAITAGDIPTLTLSKISDAGALAAKATIDSASLLDDGVVETAKIATNAVTNADSSSVTTSNASWTTEDSFTQVEICRHTQTLTTGSTAILDVRFTKTEVAGSSVWYLSSTGLTTPFSPTRDIKLRLIRDPDGTPVVLKEIFIAEGWNGNTSPYGSFQDFANSNFIYEDTTHSGGSTTYAVDMVSYSTGTTTPNGVKYAMNNVTRTIYCLEGKR